MPGKRGQCGEPKSFSSWHVEDLTEGGQEGKGRGLRKERRANIGEGED